MSSSFYTHVLEHGDNVIHRYVDETGERKITIDKPILHCYVQSDKGLHTGLFGTKLKDYTFDGCKDYKEFIKSSQLTIHGSIAPKYQYISNIYTNDIMFNMNNIYVANVDIETDVGDSFPEASKAEMPINSITVSLIGHNTVVTWTTLEYDRQKDKLKDEADIRICTDEYTLLYSFLTWWKDISPDAITGWNIKGFDIPYIINRARQVIPNMVNNFSPVGHIVKHPFRETYTELGDDTYSISGLDILDYIDVFQKFELEKMENMRLETIANYVLGYGKDSYDEYNSIKEFMEQNPTKFVRYNIKDVCIIDKMDEKLNYIISSYEMAYLAKVNVENIFKQVNYWDVLLYNAMKKGGIVIPPQQQKMKEKLIGAFVRDVIVGRSRYIAAFDLTSLYPKCMCQYNMSPETIVYGESPRKLELLELLIQGEDCGELKFAREHNLAMAANGSMYSKEKKGWFPRVIDMVFLKRKEYKKLMLETEQLLENYKKQGGKPEDKEYKRLESIIATYDAKQMAMKIAINSLYGATGNVGFRYHNHDLAEGITLSGQLASLFIGIKINNFINSKSGTSLETNNIVAGDTDSVYVTLANWVNKITKGNPKSFGTEKIIDAMSAFCAKEIEPVIESQFAWLATHMNAYKNEMFMKREILADEGIWRAKKNYVLRVWDNEGVRYSTPKLKMKGIETAKSSTPPIVKEALEEALEIMLDEEREADLLKSIAEFKTKFMNCELDLIARSQKVNGIKDWVEGDFNWKSRAPSNVRAALTHNRLLKQHNLTHIPPITDGYKIRLLKLSKPNPVNINYIAYMDELPKEFHLHDFVDRKGQYESLYLNPVISFTSIIGMKHEDNFSLDDFF